MVKAQSTLGCLIVNTILLIKFTSTMQMQTMEYINAYNLCSALSPAIGKRKLSSTKPISAENIPRPQLLFKDKIDNSRSIWVPKISYKPNSVTPLTLEILYNEKREAVGYEHPYKAELDLYCPPRRFTDPDLKPIAFPKRLTETRLTYIDNEQQLNALVRHLTTVSEFAVDLEHHSFRSYQGITCLIQITTEDGGDFIIDTLAVREHVHKLNVVFTDPKKLKIFHGADMDVQWLQRDFGVYLVGLFDTHQAARVLLPSDFSLKNLVWHYCHVDLDKKYQLADWRVRPLPLGMIVYARSDTHYLLVLYIWRQMKVELLYKGLEQLLYVFAKSLLVCGKTYMKKGCNKNSLALLYRRCGKSFNPQQLAAFKMLYKWRDTVARALDEGTSYVMPDHMLVRLAENLPLDVQGVHACCTPVPPLVEQNAIALLRMILSCRELPLKWQQYQTRTSTRTVIYARPTPSLSVHDFPQDTRYRED